MARTSGEAGQPGQPGEPGYGGGGAGGTGGRDGRGGRVTYRGIILFVTVVALTLSIGTLLLVHHVDINAGKIGALQRSDAAQGRAIDAALRKANAQQDQAIVLIRQADYRLCLRQQVTRAAINLDRDLDEPTLPLYDCTPNLTGGKARPFTPSQTRAFIRRMQRSQFVP
jgi:hypothetical protein